MRGISRSDAGLAAIELALAAPIILLLLLGAADFGLAFYTVSRVEDAVQAGGQYAQSQIVTGKSITSANIKSVVQSSTNLGLSADNITVDMDLTRCYCPHQITGDSLSGVAYVTVADTTTACSTTCSSSGMPYGKSGKYVAISATHTYQTLLGAAEWLTGRQITKKTVIRVQ